MRRSNTSFLVRFCGWLAAASICLPAVAGRPSTSQRATAERGPIVLTERAMKTHRNGLLVDGHNDLPWQIREQAGSSFDTLDIALPQAALQTDIPRLRRGGVDAQFWVVYAPPESARSGTAKRIALEQFKLIHRMVRRYSDVFELALTADDVVRIAAKGKIAALIGVEGGHMIENSLEVLAQFHKLD